MTRSLTIALAGVLMGALVTVATQFLWARIQPPPTTVTCRPTAPAVATQDSTVPVVLFWGNSLLFDHGWQDPNFVAVNCAQQGMTAADALRRTTQLPTLPADAILIAFGSVELARSKTPTPAMFMEDVAAIVALLRSRHPNARIWLSGVPSTSYSPSEWHYTPTQALLFNTVLQEITGTEYMDLSDVLRRDVSDPHNYDGIHLSAPSYAAWQRDLAQRVAALPD